jgi:hypothetical protein
MATEQMTDSKKKPVLLLNWCYFRTDITAPLLQLADNFTLIFLYDYDAAAAKEFPSAYKLIFWNDYSTPFELLDNVNPSKIVFYDIESFHQVALVSAARKRKIKTFVLEHGLRGAYEVDAEIERFRVSRKDWKVKEETDSRFIEETAPDQSRRTLKFYAAAIKKAPLFEIPLMLFFIYYRKRFGLTLGLYLMRKKFRWADQYINFTETNASYIMKRDGVPLSYFRFAGNPGFDSFFKTFSQFASSAEKPYLLLLDAPFVETGIFKMSVEDKKAFIKRLNDYALSKELKLYIKLHPLSYNSGSLIEHSNIVYFKATDLTKLILNSFSCVHIHFSSLMPLALLYKPYLFFNTYPEFNVPLKSLGIAELNFNSTFDNADPQEVSSDQKNRLIEDYLFATDGKAMERITQYLLLS